MPDVGVRSFCTLKRQSETDLQGVVYPRHGRFVQFAHAVFQPPFVQCADLLQQHHAVLCQSAGGCLHVDVGGQLGFFPPAGDRRRNHGGAVPVSDIVLHNKYRSDTALFRADNGAQVCIINFATLDQHGESLLYLSRQCRTGLVQYCLRATQR